MFRDTGLTKFVIDQLFGRQDIVGKLKKVWENFIERYFLDGHFIDKTFIDRRFYR